MAKKRRIKNRKTDISVGKDPNAGPPLGQRSGVSDRVSALSKTKGPRQPRSLLDWTRLGSVGLLFSMPIIVTYHPSDSTEVESGAALWFCAIAVLFATCTWILNCVTLDQTRSPAGAQARKRLTSDWIIDASACALAVWICVAAWGSSPPGNLRLSTNEAWLWIAGAGVFCSARRWMGDGSLSRATVCLLLGCSVAVSIHALHQDWVSLPRDRLEYLDDPDAMLGKLGLAAPYGSAMRMIFENRLFDGGPTATFALANSMAGVVLVGSLLATAVLRENWSRSSTAAKILWAAISVICIAGLLAARSRSGLGGLVVGLAAIWIFLSPRQSDPSRLPLADRDEPEKPTLPDGADDQAPGASGFRWVWLLVTVAGLVSSVTMALFLFGRKEWAEQAPASLAFRLQYWRATLRMALDRPVFGAGPGNFQTTYLRYREPGAGEAISDPHNFAFETLASGGWIGVILLVVLAVAAVWVVGVRRKRPCDDATRSDHHQIHWTSAAWFSAAATLAGIWLWGLAIGILPDWQAHLFAVPAAIATVMIAWKTTSGVTAARTATVAAIALVGLMIHLSAAGGWTVPGVAIHIWLLAGIVTQRPSALRHDPHRGSLGEVASAGDANPPHVPFPVSRSAWIAGLVGISLLITLRVLSLGPVTAARAAQARVIGPGGELRERALRQAVEADPWAKAPAIAYADHAHVKLIRQDTAERRRQWRDAIRMVHDRCGSDPTASRDISRHHLHLFQRHGLASDLDAAADELKLGLQASPTDHTLMAQLAAVLAAKGDRSSAVSLVSQAKQIAIASGDVVRALERQYILAPRHFPNRSDWSPVMGPATEILEYFSLMDGD